ncbi:hypothetical protein CRG98_018131 [Punica granatum]|uniref:Pentacotripeptide-repeat region of PRORP domain-containing protein n=1 Tax=Punica granatum TaxID=22663 RepID=A0A2I0JYP0_PUNGR|nr:hypothetical protein CRG98_018131 [Punica granatum]
MVILIFSGSADEWIRAIRAGRDYLNTGKVAGPNLYFEASQDPLGRPKKKPKCYLSNSHSLVLPQLCQRSAAISATTATNPSASISTPPPTTAGSDGRPSICMQTLTHLPFRNGAISSAARCCASSRTAAASAIAAAPLDRQHQNHRLLLSESLTSVAHSPASPSPIPELLSILSSPNWQKNPALRTLIPSITPSHVSSLFAFNVDPQTALGFFNWIAQRPGFKHNVQSHSSLLAILIPNNFLGVAEKVRLSMIKCCDSVDDARFLLDFVLSMNRDSGLKFKLTVRCYNTLLMSLSRFLMIDEMKKVYIEMLDEKVSPNIYTFNTMINAYCKLGKVAEAEVYVRKIFQAGLSPDTFTYTSLILGCCRNRDVDGAYGVFVQMPQKGCRRNEVSYTNLLHGLCEAKRVDEALKLFSQMGEDNCFPTVRTYTVLIWGLCGSNRRSEAMDLFEEMPKRGCQPNLHTYTVLMDSMCKDNKVDEARRMLDGLLEKGLVPNVVTYNALMDGYCKEGRMDDALEVLALLESNSCSPNARTYNELICGYSRIKNLHKAMALLDRMIERKLSPDLMTYNSLIHGQCKLGELDTAYRLLDMMEESGLAPDQWTYGFLIDTLCKKSRVQEAHDLFESLPKKGVKANEVMYTALIDGCCKAGKLEDAKNLVNRMLEEGCLPNSCTYNALIDGLCKEGKMEEALNMVEKVTKDLKPTVHTYTIMIKQMLAEGDFDHAQKVFEQMVSSGLQPDVFTYTTFLHAYCIQGRVKEAEHVMDKMKKEGIVPDSLTYTLLIDAYGRLGLLPCAFDVLKRMFAAGCVPSHHTYSFLLKHILIEKQVKENGIAVGLGSVSNIKTTIDLDDVWNTVEFPSVLELFDKMSEHGCYPDLNTYTKLIIGFCNKGRLEIAFQVFGHMEERGITPNEKTYISLINCCCAQRLLGEAMKLMDGMIEQGLLPQLESYKLLLCGLYDEEENDKAKEAFCSLLEHGYNHDEVAWKLLVDGLLKRGFVDRCSELLGNAILLLSSQYFSMMTEPMSTVIISSDSRLLFQYGCFHVLRSSGPPFVPPTIFIKQGLASFLLFSTRNFWMILRAMQQPRRGCPQPHCQHSITVLDTCKNHPLVQYKEFLDDFESNAAATQRLPAASLTRNFWMILRAMQQPRRGCPQPHCQHSITVLDTCKNHPLVQYKEFLDDFESNAAATQRLPAASLLSHITSAADADFFKSSVRRHGQLEKVNRIEECC